MSVRFYIIQAKLLIFYKAGLNFLKIYEIAYLCPSPGKGPDNTADIMKDRKLLNIELHRMTAEEYKSSPDSGIAVVLDNIRSAHNVGSAFRSSDSFKIDRICLCGICATPPSAEIHKSAIGAEFSVPWEHFDRTTDAIEMLKSEGYCIVSVEQTVNSVSLDVFSPEEGKKYAFIFGNEVNGVDQEVVDASDFSLEIPQYGTKHSLNVSVAVGIVLWAAVDKMRMNSKS